MAIYKESRLIVVLLGVVFLTGAFLIILRSPLNRFFRFQVPVQTTTNTGEFVTRSLVPEYDIAIADAAYLQWVANKLGLFDENGVIDASAYFSTGVKPSRYTVSRVEFRLADHVNVPVVMDIDTKAKPPTIPTQFGQAGYAVEGETLVVSVWLNTSEIAKRNTILALNALETKFTYMALQALYAASVSGSKPGTSQLLNVRSDLSRYAITGIVRLPFVVKERQ